MKNPSSTLLNAYMNALKSSLSYNLVAVPVYNTILPEAEVNNYVLINEISGDPISSKQRDYKNIGVQISVVTIFDSFILNTSVADDILDQIFTILEVKPDLSPDFNLVVLAEEQTEALTQQLTTKTIHQKIVRYRNEIERI